MPKSRQPGDEFRQLIEFITSAYNAVRKLQQVNAATSLEFLRVPPGNRLETLSGDRAGQYSIRINDQWRVCFVWQAGNASAVEIIDYD